MPAFYLRRFGDSDQQIERVDKATRERMLMPVRNATVEVDFYTVETDEGPSDMIEQHLSQIESEAASALQHLDEEREPTDRDISGLCNFIALQVVRGPRLREKVDALKTDALRVMLKLEAGSGQDRVATIIEEATGRKPSDEEVRVAMGWMSRGDFEAPLRQNERIAAMLEAGSELVEPFSKMRWKVAKYDEPMLFTSDHPVSLWVENSHPFLGVGVLNADQISLPISPTRAFVIYPQDGESNLGPPSAGELNGRTINSAHRWIFMDPGWRERAERVRRSDEP